MKDERVRWLFAQEIKRVDAKMLTAWHAGPSFGKVTPASQNRISGWWPERFRLEMVGRVRLGDRVAWSV